MAFLPLNLPFSLQHENISDIRNNKCRTSLYFPWSLGYSESRIHLSRILAILLQGYFTSLLWVLGKLLMK